MEEGMKEARRLADSPVGLAWRAPSKIWLHSPLLRYTIPTKARLAPPPTLPAAPPQGDQPLWATYPGFRPPTDANGSIPPPTDRHASASPPGGAHAARMQ